MSGRWRSRHWSEGEGSTTGRHRDDLRRPPPDVPDGCGRIEDEVVGEWRRGQALPPAVAARHPPPGPRGGERTPAPSSSCGIASSPNATQAAVVRKTLAAAPARMAWGSGSSSSSSNVSTKGERGEGRKDAAKEEKGEEKKGEGEKERSDTENQRPATATRGSRTAWAVPVPAPPPPTTTQTRARDPTNVWAKAVTDVRTGSVNGKIGVPSSSLSSSSSTSSMLPAASSWGKGGGDRQQRVTDTRRADDGMGGGRGVRKAVADEFPSLLVASRMAVDRTPPPATTTMTTTTIDDDDGTKRRLKTKDRGDGSSSSSSSSSSDKVCKRAHAATTSLASFLSPHPLASAGGPSGRGLSSRPSSTGRASAATASSSSSSSGNKAGGVASSAIVLAGLKRSAPHAGDNLRTGGEFGMEFPTKTAAGSKKGGRVVASRGGRLQRLGAPRKKKLTSLKKKVLKERLRMWKERNGIVDGGDENDDDDDDDIGEGGKSTRIDSVDLDDIDRPSAKRSRTGGASPGDALEVTSTYLVEGTTTTTTTTLLVENFVHPDEDDLLDDDEYEEIKSDLILLAGRVGSVATAFVPRPLPRDDRGDVDDVPSLDDVDRRHVGSAIVRFATDADARAARDVLDGIVVGGRRLRTSILESIELAQLDNRRAGREPAEINRDWRAAVLRILEDRRLAPRSDDPFNEQKDAASAPTTIVFHNILCDDDFEDEESLRESIEDIKGLAQQHGCVIDARGSTSGNDRGNVYIVFGDKKSADIALRQLNGLVIGGSAIVVSRDDINSRQQSGPGEVVLSNALNDDDFEDEDCLHESLADIRSLAEQYGTVGSVHANVSGKQRNVHVSYLEGHRTARQAAQRLDGMMLGGIPLSASAVSPADYGANDDKNDMPMKKEPATAPPPPIYSGDKIIPEQFAACKRVPKIPNPGTPRSYASEIADERAVTLLTEMLGELMRLQERSKDDKNARARRRIVMGLREVARGIRAHKVKMVVMANNLDEYGAIDSKLQEILDLARTGELPVLYELNKRKLGKALGKSIKVSVVGIQNADGAHEQFKKLKKMVGFL